jgi:hypothetical protein
MGYIYNQWAQHSAISNKTHSNNLKWVSYANTPFKCEDLSPQGKDMFNDALHVVLTAVFLKDYFTTLPIGSIIQNVPHKVRPTSGSYFTSYIY